MKEFYLFYGINELIKLNELIGLIGWKKDKGQRLKGKGKNPVFSQLLIFFPSHLLFFQASQLPTLLPSHPPTRLPSDLLLFCSSNLLTFHLLIINNYT